MACTPVTREQTGIDVPVVTVQPVEAEMKLTTSDGYTLGYTYYTPFVPEGAPGAILLHQLGRDRHDYDQFAPRLADLGFHVITVDIRGHGESSGSWKDFLNTDFALILNDLFAAKALLNKKGADTTRLLIIGESITANAAINYAGNDDDVKTLIAISPGLEYRGVKTGGAIFSVPEKTLLVAAKDDDYSEESVKELSRVNPEVETKLYDKGGHGMYLLSVVAKDMLDWIDAHRP